MYEGLKRLKIPENLYEQAYFPLINLELWKNNFESLFETLKPLTPSNDFENIRKHFKVL
jgi:hypothetical protein